VRRVRQRAMLNAAADPSIPMIVERSSTLARPAEEVWAEVTTPSGINWELRPWLRMTVPRRFRTLSLQDVELGALVCRSWVLLLGLVPFEYDDLVLVERGPRLRFLELSSTLATRMWQHERVVEPSASGCTLTDRVSFALRPGLGRLPGLAATYGRAVQVIFVHRHRRLEARYGAAATPPLPT
jgi:hypothetical protein